MYTCQGRRQRGGQWCPDPHLKSVLPHFTFGPPVVAYIQYCILKRCPPLLDFSPLFYFWPSLLLNPGDGPDTCITNFWFENEMAAVRISQIRFPLSEYNCLQSLHLMQTEGMEYLQNLQTRNTLSQKYSYVKKLWRMQRIKWKTLKEVHLQKLFFFLIQKESYKNSSKLWQWWFCQ